MGLRSRRRDCDLGDGIAISAKTPARCTIHELGRLCAYECPLRGTKSHGDAASRDASVTRDKCRHALVVIPAGSLDAISASEGRPCLCNRSENPVPKSRTDTVVSGRKPMMAAVMFKQGQRQFICTVMCAMMHKKIPRVCDERASNESTAGDQISQRETNPYLPKDCEDPPRLRQRLAGRN
jgi:hypothetical protein